MKYPLKRYSEWAGNQKGFPYDNNRCAKEVSRGGRSVLLTQCSRRRGFGRDGLFCKQHKDTTE